MLPRRALLAGALLILGYSILYSLGVRGRHSLLPTCAGYLFADQQSGGVLEKLEQTVNRGSTLFIHACLTSLYPHLDVINSAPRDDQYLQPGMRNARDESRLAEESIELKTRHLEYVQSGRDFGSVSMGSWEEIADAATQQGGQAR
ncbi:MAG: hypothetical protein ACK5TN_12335 [Acidobacteriota bacterium]